MSVAASLLFVASLLPQARSTPSQTPAPPPAPTAPTVTSYVIGPQDQLKITVYDEADLTGNYRVDDLGMITFPLLNRVPASGLTIAEFQDKLKSMLAAGYIRNPQVRVDIDQYKSQSVFVMGEVRMPGKITLTGTSMTLLEALAAAGSPTTQASNQISVLHPKRPNAGGPAGSDHEGETIRVNIKDLQAVQNVLLRDGDIITVPKAETFYIQGQVKNSGHYVLDPGMTVQQAIALAGGLSERGSDRGIITQRLIKGKITEVPVKLDDQVQANDTIIIRGRFF